jgi:small neutral amino acid transporter SnatA (MarC family)
MEGKAFSGLWTATFMALVAVAQALGTVDMASAMAAKADPQEVTRLAKTAFMVGALLIMMTGLTGTPATRRA